MNGIKYFVEIGSCNFDNLNAQLGKKGWKGIVVEPVKEYYDSLQKHEGVYYVNAAIDNTSGTRNMDVFRPDVVDRDPDFAGMSSFSEYTLEENKRLVSPREVTTMTYLELISTYPIPVIDFLKIDTEGHDWVILQDVVYDGPRRPRLIKFEYTHFKDKSYKVRKFLEDKGYLVYTEHYDMYAIDITG